MPSNKITKSDKSKIRLTISSPFTLFAGISTGKQSLGQRLGQAYKVLGDYANEAATRAVDVRY
jgi:hypothetical protein